jgi:hypothetical protein
MTDDELDAAVKDTLVAVPMAALDGLMNAAQTYLDILKQRVRTEDVEQLAQAMRAHTSACEAISHAYAMATAELERGMLKGLLH